MNETNNYSKNININLNDNEDSPIIFIDGYLISDFVIPPNKSENLIKHVKEAISFCPYNGFEYYQVLHEQKLSLFTSNKRFEYKHYFKFFDCTHKPIEIDSKSECKTSIFPNGVISDISELQISKISFYESKGVVFAEQSPPLSDDSFAEIISECQQLTSVQIKNLIVHDQELKTKIENYWICLSLGHKLNEAFMNFPNFDLVDQPSASEIINDSTNILNNILASNINLSANSNFADILLENVFYLSYNTRLTLNMKLIQCSLRPNWNDSSIFSVEGKLLNVERLSGTCCVYLTSFNLVNGPFMKLIHGSAIKNSEFNTGSLIAKYREKKIIYINGKDHQLPFSVEELFFFVKLYFKNNVELYCIYCFQVPLQLK